MDSRESALELAIDALNDGETCSVAAAAREFGIPRTTLISRLQGHQNIRAGHQNQQRMTPEQEEAFSDWIPEEDASGAPPSHTRAREMASRILCMNGDTAPIGKRWIQNFLKRNPRVSSVVGRKIEAPRAKAGTQEQVGNYLKLFDETRKRLRIETENIYNMDETGIALGLCTNTQVLASSKKKKTYYKSPENREWVSIIETISASGRKLRCLTIFKGKSLQSSWFNIDQVPDWVYTYSENGWTSNNVGIDWLNQIFIPESQPKDPSQYRLLILDGHGSHASVDFHWACKTNKIHLLYLPAHTSHILQPLDLAPFSCIKGKYRSTIGALAALDDAAPVKKARFITCYSQAREEGLSEHVIRAGWRASGMVPFNMQKVLESTQVLQRPSTPERQKRPHPDSSPSVQTPRKPQDLYNQTHTLQLSDTVPRDTRVVLRKAGKAIGNANTRAAMLEAEVSSLKLKLDRYESKAKAKKKVQVDPNTRFAEIGAIKKALDEAQAQQVINTQREAQFEARMAREAQADVSMESMQFDWQL